MPKPARSFGWTGAWRQTYEERRNPANPNQTLETVKHHLNLPHVRWQLQRAGHQLRHRETKTPGSTAVLPLPGICTTALRLRAECQAADRLRVDDAWQDNGLVFTSACGTPYEPRNFNRQFAVRCGKAGVRHIKVHDTRRTCASLLVALDVHPGVAMQILRHSQISMTMEVYSEVPSAKARTALKRLGRKLDG